MAASIDTDALESSLEDAAPPTGLSGPVEALWHAARGEWDRAHRIVQDDGSAAGSHVHAWLHRVEGDLPNADYWYHQAGVEPARGELQTEWREIADRLLAR